jgi:hypothetical protein
MLVVCAFVFTASAAWAQDVPDALQDPAAIAPDSPTIPSDHPEIGEKLKLLLDSIVISEIGELSWFVSEGNVTKDGFEVVKEKVKYYINPQTAMMTVEDKSVIFGRDEAAQLAEVIQWLTNYARFNTTWWKKGAPMIKTPKETKPVVNPVIAKF